MKNKVLTKEIKEKINFWVEKKDKYDVIGRKVPRVDARSKAVGKAVYVDDVILPGMLYGKILLSPYPHARILNIDKSKAEQLPGVKAVITGQDVPKVYMVGSDVKDEPLLAWDGKVRFVGQEIAAVAATDIETAEKALSLIKVDYEELPAVLNVDEAICSDAPPVHDEIIELKKDPDIFGKVKVRNNVGYKIAYDRGDIDQGFSEADVIVEEKFFIKNVVAAYMEPDGCVASYDSGSEKLTLWVGSQWPSNIRDVVSMNLGVPLNKTRVIQNAVGGAFGSKFTALQIHHIAALLALKAGKPVKLIRTRTEDFMHVRSRGDMKVWMKLGAKKDGTITAEHTKILVDNGAYQYTTRRRSLHMLERNDALYRFENVRHDVKNVYTNKTPAGMFRSFGDAPMTWVRESLLDMLAEKLRMDQAELRLKNATQTGDITVNGWHIGSSGFTECIRKACEEANWKEKKENQRYKRGIGIACTCHETDDRAFDGFCGSVCYVKLLEDGGVQVLIGEADYGQGSHNAFAIVVAEELGVDLKNVEVVPQDTDIVPWGKGALGSRVMSQGVNATYLACQEAKKQIIEVASEILEVELEALEFNKGNVYKKNSPEAPLPLAKIAAYARQRRGGSAIVAKGVEERYDTEYILKVTHPTHYGRGVDATYFDTVIAEVEVNTETGELKILNIVVADDCGKVIDRNSLEGQIDGAVVQGIGVALMEEIVIDDKGRITNPNFNNYKVPRAVDVPPIKKIFIESIEPGYAYGCKGGGESAGICSIVPAIANAIYNAVGVRIKSTPITKEKILQAMTSNK